MTPIIKRLHKVHTDLWCAYNPVSILTKNYVALLFDKFTHKSWILLLRSKNEFFDIFKLCLPRAEARGNKLDCLQTDGGREFISTALQSFSQERGIKIGYAAPYMHEENGIAKQCWKTLAQMKDSLLINSGLPIQFWAKTMDTANYLRNWLPTRHITNNAIIIPEEAWTEVKQNLEHIWIFGSKINMHIASEKRSKSDVYKIWNGIFIRYTDTTKHPGVWALKTYQVLIASEPIVNESKQRAKLLVENPIPTLAKPFCQSAGKPKSRERSRKRTCIENKAENGGSVEAKALDESGIRTKNSHNYLVQRPRTDRGGTSGKNPPEGLIRPAHKFAKSVTETSSKVHEPKIYDEDVNNPVHGNKWRKAINKEL